MVQLDISYASIMRLTVNVHMLTFCRRNCFTPENLAFFNHPHIDLSKLDEPEVRPVMWQEPNGLRRESKKNYPCCDSLIGQIHDNLVTYFDLCMHTLKDSLKETVLLILVQSKQLMITPGISSTA